MRGTGGVHPPEFASASGPLPDGVARLVLFNCKKNFERDPSAR
jgi:hypothetical protein